ncbi:MAG: CBS domain-containing protein [Pirellulales bacterium]
MNKAMAMCRGAALGAGLMYFFDPRQGARRRALIRDACVRLSNETRQALDVTRRDMGNRLQGLKSEVTSYFSGSSSEPVGDEQLKARIRSHLGRVSSHPRALEIEVHDGRVRLRGPVIAAESQRVFDCVRCVPGVRHVDNEMEQHQEAGNISALQGGSERPGEQWDILQERWSPSTRLLVGAGAASLLACASGRGLLAGTLGAIGLGIMTGNTPRRVMSPNRRVQPGTQHRQTPQGRSGRQRGRFSIGGLSDRGEYEFGEERNGMKVSNIMTPSPATCHRQSKLQEVARLMLQCDCGAIPVVEDGTNRPLGIITDRDITVRAIAEGRDPQSMTVGDCMSSPVETISSEATLEECVDKMESSQIRRMIVVDADNKTVGIVAQADIAMYAPQEETAELLHDVSTPAPAPTI